MKFGTPSTIARLLLTALVFTTLQSNTCTAGVIYLATGDAPRQIDTYDQTNGALLGSIGNGFLGQPFGINFAPDGSLVVSDNGFGSGSIERFDPVSGQHLDTVASGITGTGPLIVLKNGNILLGNDRITEYAPGGTPLRTFGYRGLDMELGPNGLLYVAQHVSRPGQSKTVYGYDLTTGNVAQVLPIPAEFLLNYQPLGLTFDLSGFLLVSQNDPFGSQKILKFDIVTNEYVGLFAELPGTRGISDIDFGEDGNLYAALSDDNRIVVLDGINAQLVQSIDNVNEPRQLAIASLATVPEPSTMLVFVLTLLFAQVRRARNS